jgi:hypothetical protein
MSRGAKRLKWLANQRLAQDITRSKIATNMLGLFMDGPGGQGPFPSGLTPEMLGLPPDFSTTPGSNELIDKALGKLEGLDTSALTTGAEGALTRLLSGEQAATFDPALRERYWQQSVVDPALRRFKDQTRALGHRYGRLGGGGAFTGSLAEESVKLQKDLAGLQASMLRDDERTAIASREAALNRMGQAVPVAQNWQTSLIQALGAGGEFQRGLEGELLTDQLNRAVMASPYGDPRWQYLSAVGGAPGADLSALGGPKQSGLATAMQFAGPALKLFGGGGSSLGSFAGKFF